MLSCTVIKEGPANEVLIVFKASNCSTQNQTLLDNMLNYDNHVDFLKEEQIDDDMTQMIFWQKSSLRLKG